MAAWDKGQEELGTIRIRSFVSHGQIALICMLSGKVFVFEHSIIDGTAFHTDFTSLGHELRNNSMERSTLIMKRFSTNWAITFLTCAQTSEVFSCPRNNITMELNNNSPCILPINCNI